MINYLDSDILINPRPNRLEKFNPKLRIAIFASGKGSNFKTIISDIENGNLDAEIECIIVNNPMCGALKIANQHSIPSILINHNDFNCREDMDKAIVSSINQFNIEGIVMVGWMRIVTNILLEQFKGRIINIHPSLLPSFKGNNAIKEALDNKVKITGCTVHIVEQELDSGEILIQSAVPVFEEDDFKELQSRIQKAEHKIISHGIHIAGKRWRNY